jgi:hypothetical protein
MKAKLVRALTSVVLALLACLALRRADSLAAETGPEPLAAQYGEEVRPLLKRHCWRCHSTSKRQEGDVDLERFATFAEVRGSPRTWQKVLEMLDSGQMPPRTGIPLSDADRLRLRTWVRSYLRSEARARAGDPGPVVLRRLSNAEYTWTVRDLTGLPDLDPTRQFPVDSAAGEGFSNTGQALVMSPALLGKYLEAAKEIASHAVLLPDGLRFSPATTRRDRTNEILAQIRALYQRYSASQGSTRVNLQGIVFDTNDGGRLPLENYLAATLAEREALQSGRKTITAIARARGLSPRYLASLWEVLNGKEPAPLLDMVRARWRKGSPADAAALTRDIAEWQKVLTRFQRVGHMKTWMVPVNPITARQEIRLKVPASARGKDVVLSLLARDAGDGPAGDVVVWHRPRFVLPGRPDVLLRDVRAFTNQILPLRQRYFEATAKCLAAAQEVRGRDEMVDVADLARRHDVDVGALKAWLDYLGIRRGAELKLDYLTGKLNRAGSYEFVKGWGKAETPSLVANSSDQHVRIPGNMKPHGVCVHPSPTLRAVVGWRSPITGVVQVQGKVTDAHPECGNGVTWSLEWRRGGTRRRLAAGLAQGGKNATLGPIEKLAVQKGDLLSVKIGPRDGNHACDLTDVEFIIETKGEPPRQWSLTRDVSSDVLAANPHADSFGNEEVWHFYTEPVTGSKSGQVIPAGSVLARWLEAEDTESRNRAAAEVQRLLTHGPPAEANHPDTMLYRQLTSLSGPLFAQVKPTINVSEPRQDWKDQSGLDPALFGKESADLVVQAPSVLEIRLPAGLFAGAEFITTGTLEPTSGAEGSVQLQVLAGKADGRGGLRPDLPVVLHEGSQADKRWERAFAEFRSWFPAALCYTRIVPVDEVVTLTLFHREDEPLCRLMLNEEEKARLDRLWEELHFVSQDALKQVDAFQHLMEYATQDSDPKLFEPFRKPIYDRAAAFRKALLAAEPGHVEAVLDFAARAYRRPLSGEERDQLRGLYHKLRKQELGHEEAIQFLLARVLVAPAFLYRLEKPPPGKEPGPVSDWELASRLSYFLWSSLPDASLRELAASGRLRDPDVLAAQARRMLKDDRVRRLAIEFGCQWLHIHGFDRLDEKSERLFPSFAELSDDMYEEPIRFFTDLFQNDRSVLDVFDGDYTLVNEALAKHYGIPGVSGPKWRRINVRRHGRGGILGMAATLAKQSGASRTSPTLRGNWISEVLLGEKLPRPPKGVPQLPEDEGKGELTVRQLVQQHASDPRCAVCHARIDPLGFALEGFDAIGRLRTRDLAGRPIDTRARLKDGTEFTGLSGLRQYLVEKRRDDILHQFCRKLLGYALGRSVQLSDELLLEEMQQQLEKNGYRISAAVETIIRSQQFRQIRGRDMPAE